MAGKKITKTELIKRVAKLAGTSKKTATEVLNAFFAEIRKELKKTGSVRFLEKDHDSGHCGGFEFKIGGKKDLVVSWWGEWQK